MNAACTAKTLNIQRATPASVRLLLSQLQRGKLAQCVSDSAACVIEHLNRIRLSRAVARDGLAPAF